MSGSTLHNIAAIHIWYSTTNEKFILNFYSSELAYFLCKYEEVVDEEEKWELNWKKLCKGYKKEQRNNGMINLIVNFLQKRDKLMYRVSIYDCYKRNALLNIYLSVKRSVSRHE